MPTRTKRILIVDDDADIVRNLADILDDVGYHTTTASNGSTAIDAVGAKSLSGECGFDLCLLDFRMPDMDGVELYKRINARFPNLRAIMITAYAGDDGIQRAISAGTWRVLRKPVDIRQLLTVIEEAVA